jgi:hypothetical protein
VACLVDGRTDELAEHGGGGHYRRREHANEEPSGIPQWAGLLRGLVCGIVREYVVYGTPAGHEMHEHADGELGLRVQRLGHAQLRTWIQHDSRCVVLQYMSSSQLTQLASGGVYALLWDNSGLKIYFFPRPEIPGDITSMAPNPGAWGPPKAFLPSSACDIQSHFQDHTLTFDVTLCGDWASSSYSSMGCPGTCADLIADPKNFACEYSDVTMDIVI